MSEQEVKIKEVERIDNTDSSTEQQPEVESVSELFTRFLKRHWLSIAAILYVISPIDFIPGAIFPIAGGLDDLIVLIYMFYQEYSAYKKRKAGE